MMHENRYLTVMLKNNLISDSEQHSGTKVYTKTTSLYGLNFTVETMKIVCDKDARRNAEQVLHYFPFKADVVSLITFEL